MGISISQITTAILLLSASAFSSRLVFVPSFLSSFPSSPPSLPLPFPFPFLLPFPLSFLYFLPFFITFLLPFFFYYILVPSSILPFLPIFLPFLSFFFFSSIPPNSSSSFSFLHPSLHPLGTLLAHQAHENCPLLAETSLPSSCFSIICYSSLSGPLFFLVMLGSHSGVPLSTMSSPRAVLSLGAPEHNSCCPPGFWSHEQSPGFLVNRYFTPSPQQSPHGLL